MEIAEHIAALRAEGDLLAGAADRTDWDTRIPTCPGWTMRDLVRHVGDVHRWARAHVAERRAEAIGGDELAELAGPLPADADLVEWFRAGHADLVRTLETADPATRCWSFLPAPSSLAFWARRQAHETGMHRADAESPARSITAFGREFALDGIDELLFGFFGRSTGAAGEDGARTLHLHATDVRGEWLVDIHREAMVTRREHADADCTVRGPASDLHLLLWNRRSADGLDVEGDASVLTGWRENAQIHWSRSR